MDALFGGNKSEDDISHSAKYWKRKYKLAQSELDAAQLRIKQLEKRIGAAGFRTAAPEPEAVAHLFSGVPV